MLGFALVAVMKIMNIRGRIKLISAYLTKQNSYPL
jgi:hypothetical protein